MPVTEGPDRIAFTPVAMTTAGMKNGTVTSPMMVRAPGNEYRARAHVSGSPTTTVRIVEAVACHVVNHQTCASDESAMVSITVLGRKNRTNIDATGNPKNSASAASGTNCTRRNVLETSFITKRLLSMCQAMSRDSFRCCLVTLSAACLAAPQISGTRPEASLLC